MSDRMLILTITRIEARHLADLVAQFSELLDTTTTASDDPAVARLVPDAYPDDRDASREFRRATQGDLLGRRATDAGRVLHDLGRSGIATLDDETDADTGDDQPTRPVDIALDEEGVRAWMRTLTALRLVIASRLGIETEDDHDDEDPRFGVYDWLGYRLEGLIQASDP